MAGRLEHIFWNRERQEFFVYLKDNAGLNLPFRWIQPHPIERPVLLGIARAEGEAEDEYLHRLKLVRELKAPEGANAYCEGYFEPDSSRNIKRELIQYYKI